MADVITHYITARRFLDAHAELSREFARGLCFGSQGPDLFFFGATKRSYVFSCAIHDGDPAALFANLAEDLRDRDDLYRGYALGVLLHYFGDRGLHPYVGWHCREHPVPYEHVFFETAIDMCVYERAYQKPIASFDYDAAFRRDRKLFHAIYTFWSRRLGGRLSLVYVWGCLRSMGKLTKIFLRAKPVSVRVARLYGRLSGNTAAALSHFKLNPDESAMNDAHREWHSPAGSSRESVEDILRGVVDAFTREYDALAAGAYRFSYRESFSYGA
jgi:hypothetical protein